MATVEREIHHHDTNGDSGMSGALIAIVAIVVLLILGFFAFRYLPFQAAPAASDGEINVDVNGDLPTGGNNQ